jgi:Flp pilus assembly protein TadD
LVRRASIHFLFDDFAHAHDDGIRAAEVLRNEGDRMWESRAHVNAGSALLGLGEFVEADLHYSRAQQLAEALGQELESVIILHKSG